MNPFDPALFAVGAPCLPCCTTPSTCQCALLIPPVGSFYTTPPYADYATAAAVVADPLKVASCISLLESISTASTNTATLGSNDVTLAQTYAALAEFGVWVSVNLKSGDTLSDAFSGTSSGGIPGVDQPSVNFYVYDCNGTLLFSDFSLSNSGTFTYPVTADGTYYVFTFYAACTVVSCGWTAASTVISATTLTVNPVIALWDDSGTTRQLEACPKMYLPILTESTGDWYADCASAAAVISANVSNCVGFIEEDHGGTFGSFVATDGGTSLELNGNGDGSATPTLNMWGSINATAGDVISVAFTEGEGPAPGSVATTFSLYDDTGTLIETIGPGASPISFSAAPYTGRYIVLSSSIASGGGVTYASCDATFTSSGTMSVNPIQALYDTGLSCPARLNCGDSCP